MYFKVMRYLYSLRFNWPANVDTVYLAKGSVVLWKNYLAKDQRPSTIYFYLALAFAL